MFRDNITLDTGVCWVEVGDQHLKTKVVRKIAKSLKNVRKEQREWFYVAGMTLKLDKWTFSWLKLSEFEKYIDAVEFLQNLKNSTRLAPKLSLNILESRRYTSWHTLNSLQQKSFRSRKILFSSDLFSRFSQTAFNIFPHFIDYKKTQTRDGKKF